MRNHENAVILMIVDDMMNMCLLMWAYAETRHNFYKQVFVNHIETAVNYLIRDDFSVRHAYYFDNKSGRPICETNYCGYSVGSHWARGTAWMIFGLTQALHCTKEERYIPPLIGVCEKYLSELKNGKLIPEWDFRAPGDQSVMLDTSAAAIVGCAFYILKNMDTKNPFLEKYSGLANSIYEELTGYLAPNHCENILEKTQCGERLCGSLWGDYFFVELMLRNRGGSIDFWV